MIKALILDFDNTIISTPLIGEELFAPLFDLLEKSGKNPNSMNGFKEKLMRIPFQELAKDYGITGDLYTNCIALLRELRYNNPISPYPDYSEIRKVKASKFLVTTGFTNMQESKIQNTGIATDFTRIYVVDPEKSDKTKEDIFRKISKEFSFNPEEIVVIGDNPHSEITAGKVLGMYTVLYNPGKVVHPPVADYIITHYNQLHNIMEDINRKS